jgi:hypothetical protein
MTPREQQVADRLQAYAGSLPVTHNDIHQGRDELRSRIGNRARLNTRAAVLAAAAAVVLIISAAVLRNGTERSAPSPVATPSPTHLRAPDGLAPTVDQLTGIWKVAAADETSLLVHFGADGTYAFDDSGRLGTGAASYGTYRVHGHTIDFSNLGGRACPETDSWSWLVGLPETGRLDAVHDGRASATNGCYNPVGKPYSLTRVSPQSPAGALTAGDGGQGQILTAPTEPQIHGIWLQQGTGRLLRLAPDGGYAADDGGVLDSAPDDTGSYVRVGPGRLRLTSAAGSRDCAAGARTTWQGVRVTATNLTVNVASDKCRTRADLAGTWVLLAPEVG